MNSSAEQSVTISPSTASAAPCVYTTDFYAWTQQQSALLREGRFSELDILHLIEEIESLGRSEKRELESRVTL